MQPNYQTLPVLKGIYTFGYYIVTWKENGNYKSHKYFGTIDEGASLKKNQTLELVVGGGNGWFNKK